jgi:hypothetical protein
MNHWTGDNILVHSFTCALALQIAHLMRREAENAGLRLSVRELLDQLRVVRETLLIYPSTGGRTKARRMLTETTEPRTSSPRSSTSASGPQKVRSFTQTPIQQPLTCTDTSLTPIS